MVQFVYEKPCLIRLNEMATGQVSPMDLCYSGTSPNGTNTKNYCINGFTAIGAGGLMCNPGGGPGSQCTNGTTASPNCGTGANVT